jgi:hypothetical protein
MTGCPRSLTSGIPDILTQSEDGQRSPRDVMHRLILTRLWSRFWEV